MSTPTMRQIPAGWYPNPNQPGQERRWDGNAWTSDVRGPQAPAAPVPGDWMSAPAGAPPWAPTGYGAADKNTPATVGLTLGILSVVGTPLIGIVGFVYSIMGLNRSKTLALAGRGAIGRTKSIWGIVLASIGLVWTILMVSVFFGASSTQGAYSGTALATDVTRIIVQQGSTATAVTCNDTPKTAAGIITDCKATVDGTPVGIRVTWNDTTHFTVTEQAL